MTIRTLIVDDEPLARERIQTLLLQEPDVKIIGEAANGKEAASFIDQHHPDLVFLDVQMPGLNGFEVLQSVNSNNLRQVVFVTAYDRYAVRAFEIHALDYLLKPFTEERFHFTLERARQMMKIAAGSNNVGERLVSLLSKFEQVKRYVDKLLIKDKGRIFFLQITDIDWIESAGNYIKIHVGRERYMLRETMKSMEEKLDPQIFLRIHRSSLVNTNHVKEIYPLFTGDYNVVLKNGFELTLSRNYRDRLIELFNI